jgi:hypothetical protein
MEPQYLGIRFHFNPLARFTRLLGGSLMPQTNGRKPRAAERSGGGSGGLGHS